MTTPIQNLHIDPAHYTLSWDPAPGADITTGAFCRKGRDIFVWADPGLARCSFQSLSLCHVTNFTVFLGKDRAVAGSIQFPPDDDGDHEAAAQDLRCWVHEGQLSCQWERGPKATGDVHYRMFWRDVRLGPAHNRECPHYHSLDVNTAGPAPHGGHEGCTLDLDTVLGSTPNSPDLVPQVTITVNGSGRAGPVPCMDNTVDLQRAEVLAPPTLTVECNGSEAHARWVARNRFHHGLLGYTLQVNQSSRSEPQEYNVSIPHFWVPNAGAISFRVKSRSEVYPRKLSSWSEAWGLVCPPEVMPVKTALVTSVATVLGAGLVAAGLLLHTAIIPGLRSSLTGIPQPSLPPSLLFCVHRDYPPASETNSWSSPCLTLFTRGRLPDSVPPSAHLPASSSLRFCFRSPLPSLCLVICTDGHAPASCCSLLGIPIPLPRDVTLGTVKLRQGDNRE